jgi:hypothetical protein
MTDDRSDAMQPEGYMSFLVRLWRDPLGDEQLWDWCGELEQIQTGIRWSFSTYSELLACFHQLTAASQTITLPYRENILADERLDD